MFEKFLKNAVKRLTTENPQNMTETMLNYAYAKNERVYLRYANGTEDIELCEYISQLTNENGCNLSADDVMQGYCLESGCDCEIGILYVLAVQAAELRERLKYYENMEEQGLLHMLPCKVGDTVYINGVALKISFIHIENEISFVVQFDCDSCDDCPFYVDDVSFEGEHDCKTNGYIEFTEKDIGKTVFLEKKECKQK